MPINTDPHLRRPCVDQPRRAGRRRPDGTLTYEVGAYGDDERARLKIA
jgi:hypothetical protein